MQPGIKWPAQGHDGDRGSQSTLIISLLVLIAKSVTVPMCQVLHTNSQIQEPHFFHILSVNQVLI